MIQIWHAWPEPIKLAHLLLQSEEITTVIIVADHWIPSTFYNSCALTNDLCLKLQKASQYYQHQPVFCLPFATGNRLLLIRSDIYPQWQNTLSTVNLNKKITISTNNFTNKPWFQSPEPFKPDSVIIIGAGIAGCATAYALAQRKIPVTIIDQNDIATEASGHHQGLLYAKISAHDTLQSELLLAGYSYSQNLLRQTLPDETGWQNCGILHVDFNTTEEKRNLALAAQTPDSNLYQYVNADEASHLAGLRLSTGGLWWPHGLAINPRLWCLALLNHPLIKVLKFHHVTDLSYSQKQWFINCQHQQKKHQFNASHIILCMGAHSDKSNLTHDLSFQFIRGQTTTAQTTNQTLKLNCALSGHSYIAPPWQGKICFGASFHSNNRQAGLSQQDHLNNYQQLQQWLPELAASLPSDAVLQGHAAIRCDVYDHLPVVGAIGDSQVMNQIYSKLALDKNYRIHTPCPYLPAAFINTAHGSRGLTTAPLCAEALVSTMLGLPSPLSPRLQQALQPNRLIIRGITHHLKNK